MSAVLRSNWGKFTMQVRFCPTPLRDPYVLSFGTVNTFDTFLLRVETETGIGFGEATPLPGYSDETSASVEAAFRALADAVEAGGDYPAGLDTVMARAPMVESAVASALEVAQLGWRTIFRENFLSHPIPALALVSGTAPLDAVASARAKLAAGFTTLKVKVGADDTEADIERVTAIAGEVAGKGQLRLDANQSLDFSSAERMLAAFAGMPIELFEQPFTPERDADMTRLAAMTRIPLMLDESIWTAADVERAASLSCRYVKLKLCKHPGIDATVGLVRLAEGLGLDVVFGNGVQGSVGNRTELHLYQTAGLRTAIESNGFAKLADPPDPPDMVLGDGTISILGPTDPESLFSAGKPLGSAPIVS